MKRNEEEFTDIVERYKAVIYKVCSVYADDREEMADYYQEVLANLWRSYASFRGESFAFDVDLSRRALYLRVFVRRKSSRPRSVSLDVGAALYEEDDRSLQLKELYRLIGRLNRFDRALILLWLEERSYAEISEIMGITKSNVAVKLMRIKERLQRMSEE